MSSFRWMVGWHRAPDRSLSRLGPTCWSPARLYLGIRVVQRRGFGL